MENFIQEFIFNVREVFSEQVLGDYYLFTVILTYTLLIFIYVIFIWKFYKFLAKRNILELNLIRYNKSQNPNAGKFFASLLFLLEYIIILPFLVFLWFGIFSVFLLVLSENQSVGQILLISASIIAATRLTAYYSVNLAKDVAKLFPFTVLAVFILNPQTFAIDTLISRFTQIPELLNQILVYIVFIFAVEIIMRFFFTIVEFFSSEEDVEQ